MRNLQNQLSNQKNTSPNSMEKFKVFQHKQMQKNIKIVNQIYKQYRNITATHID